MSELNDTNQERKIEKKKYPQHPLAEKYKPTKKGAYKDDGTTNIDYKNL